MNCYYHADATGTAFCRDCGRALCEQCQRREAGTVLCPEHAPFTAASASTASSYAGSYVPPNPVQTSPALAFALGFIPGVGAIYNGQYLKGLVHAVIFGAVVSILSNGNSHLEPLFGILLAAFVLYMPFEAYHTAKRRQAGIPVDEWSSFAPGQNRAAGTFVPGFENAETIGVTSRRRHAMAGPVILIGLGVLFLLDTLNLIEFREVMRYWPVILIGVGAYRLYACSSGGATIRPMGAGPTPTRPMPAGATPAGTTPGGPAQTSVDFPHE